MGTGANIDYSKGYNAPSDKFVCAECITEGAIRQFIMKNASSDRCDYCQMTSESSKIAAPMELVVKLIYDSIATEFAHPMDVLPYDDEEDVYYGPVIDTADLLQDLGLEPKTTQLLQDIVDSLENDEWAEIDYFTGREDEWLSGSWETFTDWVIGSRRYLFLRSAEDRTSYYSVEIAPEKMLDELARIFKKFVPAKTIEIEDIVYRARISDEETEYRGVNDLGPPLPRNATSGRMNAAGIPVFYGSFSETTAILETYKATDSRKKAIVGKFALVKPMTVLDFTTIPNIPSIFDEGLRENRQAISFLKSFVDDICKPVVKDGREHIDYVPTQIIAEYIHYCYSTGDGQRTLGILYPSTKDAGGICCVLFLDSFQCFDDGIEDFASDDRLNPLGIIDEEKVRNNLYLKYIGRNSYYVDAGKPVVTGIHR